MSESREDRYICLLASACHSPRCSRLLLRACTNRSEGELAARLPYKNLLRSAATHSLGRALYTTVKRANIDMYLPTQIV